MKKLNYVLIKTKLKKESKIRYQKFFTSKNLIILEFFNFKLFLLFN